MATKHIPFRFIDDRPRGPIVNVAFTIDGECVELLHQAGKNRSRTVRNAIKSYLKGGFEDLEKTHAELYINFQRILAERDSLKKEIEGLHMNAFKCDCVSTSRLWQPRQKRSILERLRNLFNKHRE